MIESIGVKTIKCTATTTIKTKTLCKGVDVGRPKLYFHDSTPDESLDRNLLPVFCLFKRDDFWESSDGSQRGSLDSDVHQPGLTWVPAWAVHVARTLSRLG